MIAEDPDVEYLGTNQIDGCTVHRYRKKLSKEEAQANILGAKKVIAGYERNVIEECKLTPEDIKWWDRQKKEAFHWIEKGRMDEAQKIYKIIADYFAEKRKAAAAMQLIRTSADTAGGVQKKELHIRLQAYRLFCTTFSE